MFANCGCISGVDNPTPKDRCLSGLLVLGCDDINQAVDHPLLSSGKVTTLNSSLKLSDAAIQRINDTNTKAAQTTNPLPRNGQMATMLKLVGTANSRKECAVALNSYRSDRNFGTAPNKVEQPAQFRVNRSLTISMVGMRPPHNSLLAGNVVGTNFAMLSRLFYRLLAFSGDAFQ